MKPNIISALLFFIFIGHSLFSQSHNTAQERIEIAGTKMSVVLPSEFSSSNKPNEFIIKEKGVVMKFVVIKGVSVTQFCDSLTPSYFSSQNLESVSTQELNDISVYKGTFMAGKVPYTRAFYVHAYKKGTLLTLVNYPSVLEEELSPQIVHTIRTSHHD